MTETTEDKILQKIDNITCSINNKRFDEITGKPFWQTLGNISTDTLDDLVTFKQAEIDRLIAIKEEVIATCAASN